jgi:hypothetical protein
MSYVRELRPYMYWLGYLRTSRDAGELDWQCIGGTWGVATSRAARWVGDLSAVAPTYLLQAIDEVRDSEAQSGEVLAGYLAKYFQDIWVHLNSAIPLVRPGGKMHYIVGNSKFYEVLIPVERVYRDMLLRAGAQRVTIVPLRKRSSKKELYEYDVIAEL